MVPAPNTATRRNGFITARVAQQIAGGANRRAGYHEVVSSDGQPQRRKFPKWLRWGAVALGVAGVGALLYASVPRGLSVPLADLTLSTVTDGDFRDQCIEFGGSAGGIAQQLKVDGTTG